MTADHVSLLLSRTEINQIIEALDVLALEGRMDVAVELRNRIAAQIEEETE